MGRARILLVRHGESEFNAHQAHLVGGQSSWAELTELGKDQARALGQVWREQLKAEHLILASTAIRATQTARYGLDTAAQPLTRINTHHALEELDQGAWTGMPRREIYTDAQQRIMDQDHWNFRPPQGESQADLFARAANVLQRRVIEPEKTAWVVCHGMVIASLLAGWAGFDRQTAWQIRLANASITELHIHGADVVAARVNDTSHLSFVKV